MGTWVRADEIVGRERQRRGEKDKKVLMNKGGVHGRGAGRGMGRKKGKGRREA